MSQCPQCKSEREPKESFCQSCGLASFDSIAESAAESASVYKTPGASDLVSKAYSSPPSRKDLEGSFKTWFTRGETSFAAGNLDDATVALREAVRCSRVLDEASDKEVQARRLLAEVLEKSGKLPEAADQYRIIAQESSTPMREHCLKKSQDLLASSHMAFDELFKREDFRAILDEEMRYVPLYCSGCKRLFAEAEVYAFRRKESSTALCWCGIDAQPLAKEDAKHSRSLETSRSMKIGQRALAIESASRELSGGKKQSTACILALVLGWCGGHKFYLGETVAGWIYFFWFWTFVPLLLSLFEALLLAQMSLTTFNMTYNLDVILTDILPDEERFDRNKSDVFSLEMGEEQTEEVS